MRRIAASLSLFLDLLLLLASLSLPRPICHSREVAEVRWSERKSAFGEAEEYF